MSYRTTISDWEQYICLFEYQGRNTVESFYSDVSNDWEDPATLEYMVNDIVRVSDQLSKCVVGQYYVFVCKYKLEGSFSYYGEYDEEVHDIEFKLIELPNTTRSKRLISQGYNDIKLSRKSKKVITKYKRVFPIEKKVIPFRYRNKKRVRNISDLMDMLKGR